MSTMSNSKEDDEDKNVVETNDEREEDECGSLATDSSEDDEDTSDDQLETTVVDNRMIENKDLSAAINFVNKSLSPKPSSKPQFHTEENEGSLDQSAVDYYRALCANNERKLADQSDDFEKKILGLTNNYVVLKESYDLLKGKYELLVRGHENIRSDLDLKTHYEKIISEKEKVIITQKMTIQECNEKIKDYESDNISKNGDREMLVKEKDDEINELKEKLKNVQESCKTNQLHQTYAVDDIFRMKPKRKTKTSSKNAKSTSCDVQDCGSVDVDLIKCNLCNKWVCELCNDVPVVKLKGVMDKCKTIYFICKTCSGLKHVSLPQVDTANLDDLVMNQHPKTKGSTSQDNENIQGNASLVKTFESMFTKMAANLETKVESLIDKKLEIQRDQATSNDNYEQSTGLGNVAPMVGKSYAGALAGSEELRRVMKETQMKKRLNKGK